MKESERQRAVKEIDVAALGKAQTRGEDIRPPKPDYDPVAGLNEIGDAFANTSTSTRNALVGFASLGSFSRDGLELKS